MNIETRYFNLKNPIVENVKDFISNPSRYLLSHREDRLDDTFAGVTTNTIKGSWYTILIYLSDFKTKEKIQTKLFVDKKFNIINEETISA